MHAYPNTSFDLAYSDEAPVLIAASSAGARAKATVTIAAAGRRIGATVDLREAGERLDQQARTGALWVEIDRDDGRAMDDFLARVNLDVAAGLYPAIVSTSADCLDVVVAKLDEPAFEVLVDAGGPERAAALAIVSAFADTPARVADVSTDNSAARLRQLSDEVNRIAATLARLSSTQAAPPPVIAPTTSDDVPPVSAERVRSVIRARRIRARFFSEELFADPAWDMLLDLLQAEIAHLRVPVSSLCIAAAVPATTALRWLKTLVAEGLFVRRADPHDGRRVFVELSPDASRALHRYFAEVDGLAGVI